MRALQDCCPFEVELVFVKLSAGAQEPQLLSLLEPYSWRGEWHVNSPECRKTICEFAERSLVWPFRGIRVVMPKPRDYPRTKMDEMELDRGLGTHCAIEIKHQKAKIDRLFALEGADPNRQPRYVKMVKNRWYWVPPDALRRSRGLKTVALGAEKEAAWQYARILNRDHLKV